MYTIYTIYIIYYILYIHYIAGKSALTDTICKLDEMLLGCFDKSAVCIENVWFNISTIRPGYLGRYMDV